MFNLVFAFRRKGQVVFGSLNKKDRDKIKTMLTVQCWLMKKDQRPACISGHYSVSGRPETERGFLGIYAGRLQS